MSQVEKYIGESKLKDEAKKKFSLKIKEGSVVPEHLSDRVVDEVIQPRVEEVREELQGQIDTSVQNLSSTPTSTTYIKGGNKSSNRASITLGNMNIDLNAANGGRVLIDNTGVTIRGTTVKVNDGYPLLIGDVAVSQNLGTRLGVKNSRTSYIPTYYDIVSNYESGANLNVVAPTWAGAKQLIENYVGVIVVNVDEGTREVTFKATNNQTLETSEVIKRLRSGIPIGLTDDIYDGMSFSESSQKYFYYLTSIEPDWDPDEDLYMFTCIYNTTHLNGLRLFHNKDDDKFYYDEWEPLEITPISYVQNQLKNIKTHVIEVWGNQACTERPDSGTDEVGSGVRDIYVQFNATINRNCTFKSGDYDITVDFSSLDNLTSVGFNSNAFSIDLNGTDPITVGTVLHLTKYDPANYLHPLQNYSFGGLV